MNTLECFKNSPYRSNKYSSYFDSYDELFHKYIGKEITFVEIGVQNGGSLFMWRKYFGPKARIIGIDLNPSAKELEKHGFEIYIGSQSDKLFWEKFKSKVGNIDVLLDDGGHTYSQQVITTEMMLSSINDGGYLIIEDTHTSYLRMFGPRKYSFINYSKKLIDKINYRNPLIHNDSNEKRIWSITFYESLVVFNINKKLSNLESKLLQNIPSNSNKKDFRYHDNKFYLHLKFLKPVLLLFRRIPFLNTVENYILEIIARLNFSQKKYFK